MFMAAGCKETPKQETSAPASTTQAVPAVPVAQQAPAEAAAKMVDIEWAQALEMSNAGAFLVDVRTAGEVAEGTAPKAVNIPLQEIDHRLAEFPKDKDIVVFCRSGKRSVAASQKLLAAGYTRVYNVLGGFMAFQK